MPSRHTVRVARFLDVRFSVWISAYAFLLCLHECDLFLADGRIRFYLM